MFELTFSLKLGESDLVITHIIHKSIHDGPQIFCTSFVWILNLENELQIRDKNHDRNKVTYTSKYAEKGVEEK